ncbi:MAG: aminotransferase class V-fold PLP-dependent enzyme [Brevundimonas sp.]
MRPDRRDLLAGGLVLAGAALAACEQQAQPRMFDPGDLAGEDGWERIRDLFALSPGTVHMSAMLIASHPAPVREAIEQYRQALDADPVTYLEGNNNRLTEAARAAAGRYFGVDAGQVALTDSATMGIGLVYNGLRLRPGQEILSTEQDYLVTHESIRLAAERSGAGARLIPLYDDIASVSADQMVERLRRAIRPNTRVLAMTWVHSSNGLKIPVRAIADMVAGINGGRDEEDRVLFCLDGVHGVGNQDEDFADLGCDFLMTSCHKWLFGPRGTGVVVGRREAWSACRPVIPSFIDDGVLSAWISREPPGGPTTAARMTPGGFKAFEHRWALPEAFELHAAVGRDRVEARTDHLASRLKAGLAEIGGVALRTPASTDLSAGIVSFDVAGMGPWPAVRALRDRGVVASVAPYATQHVRLTPSIRNSVAEVDAALAALREIAG